MRANGDRPAPTRDHRAAEPPPVGATPLERRAGGDTVIKSRAASAGIAPSPPRAMDSLVTEINDLMKKAEWTIDAYDTRNERPTGDQHTGDPGTSLTAYEFQLAS